MACDRFADALRARALGSPLPADAAAHLAVCSDCQAMLETEERVLAIVDTALEQLPASGPSPNFVSRLRAHVEHASPWTPSAWRSPAIVAVLALLVAAVVVGRLPRQRSAVRQASADRPITVPVATPAEGAADRFPKTARTDTRRNARARRKPVPEPAPLAQPEVLVPAQQREAVSRLFASLRAARPDVISMLMSLHGGEAGTDSLGLMIEPLRIEPVVVPALRSSPSIVDK
jgi:hypothetical protein